jgi:hypothetical protein
MAKSAGARQLRARTGDDGGVPGVVLGDVLLDLAHQVGAHVLRPGGGGGGGKSGGPQRQGERRDPGGA